ncbi:HYR-like domain-containing protein, partial [Flavobacterium soyangense]
NCPATPVFAVATATDACGSAFTLTSADVTTPGTCAGSYSVTRTWTAKDACNNSSTASQTINVQDITAPVIAALPANSTINCPATPVFAVATATDACGSAFTLTSADVTTPGTCAGSYSVTRTWTAKDACNNSSTASQTINVQDITAPVIAALPANSTINCPATPVFAVATATDACGSAFTLTSADVTTPGTCAGSYSVTRTWTAKDACNNSSTASQTINVQDITAPVIAALPANSTINCPATPVFAVATATDACGSAFTLTSADVTTPGTCAGSYSVTRTWTAKDSCNNSSTASQTINVQDITAPVIAALPATSTINCPATPVFAVATATDACGSAFTLTSADVTTPGTCAGSYSVTRTWTAKDACNNSSTASQTIIVQDITAPVIAALPATSTINCPATPVFAVATATDACGSAILTFADVTTPGACAGAYSITRTWTAKDACNNSSTASQTITVQDITAPTFTIPADITIIKDATCGYNAAPSITGSPSNVIDNCDSNPIVSYTDASCFDYSINTQMNQGQGYYYPVVISGYTSLTAGQIQKVAMEFTTNQGKGNAEFILIAPSGDGIVLVGSYCDGGNCEVTGSTTYSPTFYPSTSSYTKWVNSDNIAAGPGSFEPNGGTSTNSIAGFNGNYRTRFEDLTGPMNGTWTLFGRKDTPASGTLEFTGVCISPTACEGNTVIVRSWTATDACGNTSAPFKQIINVVDTTAPTWTTAAGSLDVTLECSNAAGIATAQAAFPVAADNCDLDVSNIIKVSGAFVASTCGNSGTYTNTWTVSDNCGNLSATFTQVITVQDTTKPVLSAAPADTTTECSAVPIASAADLTATDNCDAAPVVTYNEVRTDGNCASNYTLTRTWTATDVCGNASSKSQVITVQDTTKPVLSAAPADVTAECSAVPIASAADLTATDNCDAAPVVTYNEVRTDGNCASNYTLTR